MSADRCAPAEETARQLLAQCPAAPVRVRLLQDILRLPLHDPQSAEARRDLNQSPHVRVLVEEQHGDGGWGPFHSRGSKPKRRITSTEVGVERALALGLTPEHPVLGRARDYIVSLLADPHAFPDYQEQNDRWETGVRMILAGTLALIDANHPQLQPVRSLWVELAGRIFASGQYDEEAEVRAHRELTGATVKDSYLVISNRYAVAILSSMPDALPSGIEEEYLRWLCAKRGGIGYLEVALTALPSLLKPGPLDRWLASLELLSRFPTWRAHARDAVDWLRAQRDEDGLWDLGLRGSASTYFPLSDSWRRREHRKHDWSTRVLALLSGQVEESRHGVNLN
jgi:hypothetical protein